MGGGASKAKTAPAAPAPTKQRSLKAVLQTAQVVERMKRETGIKMSTDAYVRGTLRDAPPMPGTAAPRAAEPVVPIQGFGKYRFKGAVARPYLLAQGLSPDVLESPDWTQKHADAVADAVTVWAGELGALHVCHWTQPFRSATGTWRASEPTRMVHALFNPDADGKPVSILWAEYLLFGEGDSRKMIDVTSPMWVRGDTLYIPSVFAAYNNSWQADPVMDEKTPLLRSMQAVSKAGVRLLGHLGHRCTSVVPKIGLEQEFFMVSRAAYDRRPDLQRCGRTLVGIEPACGDYVDTHSAPLNRVALAVMSEVQLECFRLGIALRTRHREGGPNQYEYAPHFGLATAQIDENLVVMEIVEDVARRHGLVALFHEKPFVGVSGSGKHNNFSLSTESGMNLFNEKHANAIDEKAIAAGRGGGYDAFPTILAAVCRAIYLHGDLVLTSVATPGNDFRLTKGGGAEAPPLTISVYAGEALTKHLQEFAGSGAPPFAAPMGPFAVGKDKLELGIASVDAHGIEVSSEPRNRTAPFPYGGRRFELRAAGSSQNTAMVNVVLCSAIAEAFNFFSEQIEAGKSAREVAAASLKEHGLAAVFNGNNYTAEWKAEADKRGIWSADSIVDAMSRIETDKAEALLAPLGVYSKEELETRAELYYENYYITVTVEARVLLDMLTTRILPAAKCGDAEASELAVQISKSVDQLRAAMAAIEEVESGTLESAQMCNAMRLGLMGSIRKLVDALEPHVPKKEWPIATYHELLFDDMAHTAPLA